MSKLERKVLGVIVSILVIGSIGAVLGVVSLQKHSLNKVATLRATQMADIVAGNVERSMLLGRPDATQGVVSDSLAARGIDEVRVLNDAGADAFGGKGSGQERERMDSLRERREAEVTRQGDVLFVYRPLFNRAACQGCHGTERQLLGAVKVAIPLEQENIEVNRLLRVTVVGSVLVIAALGIVMTIILRRLVVAPVVKIERAASQLAGGDLNFSPEVSANDEIGKLSRSMRDSIISVSGVLRKVSSVSGRLSGVAVTVEDESRKVLEGTRLESEAVENISSAVEELNASIAEISESTDSLATSIEDVASSMEQMATSISEITRGTGSLFGAVEATSASIEEMSSTIRAVGESSERLSMTSEDTFSAIAELNTSIREVERNAKESAQLSLRVVDEATEGGLKSVEKTIQGMARIRDAVDRAAGLIGRLGDRSEEIGKILSVINDITEQTTLLSLNAAILASQAGEHGKGFSVVAEEIKDLAERTTFSTREIDELISTVRQEVADSVSAMSEGVRLVQEGSGLAKGSDEALKRIIETARRSSEMSVTIQRATEQQARAVSLVGDSMEGVKEIVSFVVKATSEQRTGAELIISSTEKVRDITHHVKQASEEQQASSRQISKAMETVSEKTHQISVALREQKLGAGNIRSALDKISRLPEENRQRAMTLNTAIRQLGGDADLVITEMSRFRFYDVSALDLITFGVVPVESPSEMFQRFNPLMEYLNGRLGKRVELKVASSFSEAVSDLCSGVTQICYMTPSTYIRARKSGEVGVIAMALRDGRKSHHAAIIAGERSGIGRVEDIRGKSFAFGDINSTSSYIVPRHMLHEAGIRMDGLRYYNHLGTHDDVAKAVIAGDFDAGGVMERVAVRYAARGLKVVSYSREIPEFSICAGPSLAERDERVLREALMELNGEHPRASEVLRSIDSHYTGFAAATDEEFDGVRVMMRELGLT